MMVSTREIGGGRPGVLQRWVKYAFSLASATPPNLWEEMKMVAYTVKDCYARIVEMVVVYLRADCCICRVGRVVVLPADVHEAAKQVRHEH